ncbi:hypothetical protein [Streptomyces tailanensis]|uniref:hypothetical protein n=1 Tax=Streptomyces tailanensis TaxID=2569858 RepID=UPI001FEA2AC9|nr:hypothetical protein [Streptomyces tailanensis]
MTSRLLMAYDARAKRLGVRARPSEEVRGSTRATAILDHDDPRIRDLAQRVEGERGDPARRTAGRAPDHRA